MLEWYGLRIVEPGSADPARAWQLEARPDGSAAQRQRLERWLAPTREPGGGKGARFLMSGNSHPGPGSWR
jgi:hypothetical protein